MNVLRLFKGTSMIAENSVVKNFLIRPQEKYGEAVSRAYELNPKGFILLEHDVAVSRENLRFFASFVHALNENKVVVADYPLYYPDGSFHSAHRVVGKHETRWLSSVDSTADYFGFGCIFIPPFYWKAFMLDAEDQSLNVDYPILDTTFSLWYHNKIRQTAIVCPITAVHLHF